MCERRGGTHGDEVKLDRASDPGREGRRSIGWAWGCSWTGGSHACTSKSTRAGRLLLLLRELVADRLQPALHCTTLQGISLSSLSLFFFAVRAPAQKGQARLYKRRYPSQCNLTARSSED